MDEISMKVDKDEFTLADAKTAAQEIFRESAVDFESIKERPWYKALLDSLTFQRYDKTLIIKNVRSIANLQKLFVELYTSQSIACDDELENMVNDIVETQEAVKKLYTACVQNIIPQEDIASLSPSDQRLLHLFIRRFNDDDHLDERAKERIQKYCRTIATNLTEQAPKSTADAEKFKTVQCPEPFYRCALEQCVIANAFCPIIFPDSVKKAIKYLKVSEDDKEALAVAVSEEVQQYGADYLLEKYNNEITPIFDSDGFDFEEAPPPDPTPPTPVPDIPSERPDNNYDAIANEIISMASTKKLGAPLLPKQNKNVLNTIIDGQRRKERIIADTLPGLVTKTVVEITKLDAGRLVFTTSALHWVTESGVKTIRYTDVTGSNIVTFNPERNAKNKNLAKSGPAFKYQPDRSGAIIIDDPKVDAASLIALLRALQNCGEFPETDTLTEMAELTLETRKEYLNLLAGIIAENRTPLHEVYRLAVEYGLGGYWDEVCSHPVEISAWRANIPYPNEEALPIRLIVDICRVYQYTKDSEELSADDEKYFKEILPCDDKEIEIIKRYAQRDKLMVESRKEKKKDTEKREEADATIINNYAELTVRLAGASLVEKAPSVRKRKKIKTNDKRTNLFLYIIESYQDAERMASENDELEFVKSLVQAQEALSKKAGLDYKAADISDEALAIIQKRIEAFLIIEKLYGTLKDSLVEESLQKLVSQIAVSAAQESIDDVIGVYDADVGDTLSGGAKKAFSAASGFISNTTDFVGDRIRSIPHVGEVISDVSSNVSSTVGTVIDSVAKISGLSAIGKKILAGDFSGLLFMRDGFYFRKKGEKDSSHMYYSCISRVERKNLPPTLLIHGSGNSKVSLSGLGYITPAVQKLFESISRTVCRDSNE